MKENKYDDAAFFAKYAGMHRSIFGLAGAAEWAALRAMLPDVAGKSVLDLGCGYGWHCRYFAENGASCVLGIDLSERMLAEARSRENPPAVEYRRAAMEELDFAAGSFDLVFSSLAFHYVRDFAPLAANIARWLKRGGALVCSMEHPVFTSSGPQDWDYAPEGTIRHFPVDRRRAGSHLPGRARDQIPPDAHHHRGRALRQRHAPYRPGGTAAARGYAGSAGHAR